MLDNNKGFAKGLLMELIIISVVVSIMFIMLAKKAILIKKDLEKIVEINNEIQLDIEKITNNDMFVELQNKIEEIEEEKQEEIYELLK